MEHLGPHSRGRDVGGREREILSKFQGTDWGSSFIAVKVGVLGFCRFTLLVI